MKPDLSADPTIVETTKKLVNIVDKLTDNLLNVSSSVSILESDMKDFKKLVIKHDSELQGRKKITNTYVDAVKSKIEILKNIIKKNMDDDDSFISQHLLEVEAIEEQIEQTGKISDRQFKLLNEIYLKQKRI